MEGSHKDIRIDGCVFLLCRTVETTVWGQIVFGLLCCASQTEAASVKCVHIGACTLLSTQVRSRLWYILNDTSARRKETWNE